MKTIILCGGLGTRLREETEFRPKPMVEIGAHPILWHIMKLYATYSYKEFVLALGYKGELIKNYFMKYYHLRSNLSINLGNGNIDVHGGDKEDWLVHLVDTKIGTQTGGRMKLLSSLINNETFMMTYGDGVADINIKNLVKFHRRHSKLATVTAVRPPSRFGGLSIKGDMMVDSFEEKPQIGEGWINGGFFVLEPGVLDYIEGDDTAWELGPLEQLSKDKQLMAYRHNGFWHCMDTLRDMRLLESMWADGRAPWKVWK